MKKELKSTRFIMSVEPSFLERVDDWRAVQRPVPSRAEAIRRLVEFAMSAEPLAELMALAPPGEEFRAWVNGMIAKAHQDGEVRQ